MSDDNIPSIVEFSEDITSAEAPKPLPERTYIGTIQEVAIKTSTKGNKYAAVGFHIPQEQYPLDFTDGNPDGTKLFYNRLVLSDDVRGRFMIKKFCEAIEAPMGRSIDVNDWIGKQALLTVKNSEYEGMPRAEISKLEHV